MRLLLLTFISNEFCLFLKILRHFLPLVDLSFRYEIIRTDLLIFISFGTWIAYYYYYANLRSILNLFIFLLCIYNYY